MPEDIEDDDEMIQYKSFRQITVLMIPVDESFKIFEPL